MASRTIMSSPQRAVARAIPRGRTFTTSARCLVNPLLNLSHFAASKEAQFFSKERRIPREEFSPHLLLIRSSEVDPFAPTPGASPSVVAALRRAETGQTDMQTAYTLAISNLGQQVILSRKEIAQAHATLARLHERYKREERNSFFVMLAGVALLSLIMVKTNAAQELKDYAREVSSEWRGFDWEWLGNPPSYKSGTRYTLPASTPSSHQDLTSATSSTSSLYRSPIVPVEARSDRQAAAAAAAAAAVTRRQPIITSYSEPATPSSNRWTFSRLFWAT